MATVTGKPYPGPFIFNLESVAADLIDLPDGALKGLRAQQGGLAKVLAELARSVAARGEEAGVSNRVYARIVESTGKIDALAQHERELEKATEVLRETRRKLEHDREHDIGLVVDVVKSTAQRTGDTALLAAFEETIRYKNQIPAKAAETRRKNAESRDEVEAPADGDNA
ncbi:MAG TPA: hypothetical protein VNM90_28140 [Haliangium sp.]|nr:hypothetical protein [Haliangium sp.]